MLTLVLGRSLLVLFVGWEGVGLASYLLIGFWFEDPDKARAGKKAFITNRIGDAGFLLGMFVLYQALGTFDMADREPSLNRFRAWTRNDDHSDRVRARRAELEEFAVVRQSPSLRVQQRFSLDAASGIGHFDDHFGLGEALVGFLLVERNEQVLGA